MIVQAILFNKYQFIATFIACLLTLGFVMERAVAAETRLGLKGYDPVAYFTMGRPAVGNSKFQHQFNEVRYHFLSSQHLELFSENPDKYAPRYNGLCSMGLGVNGYKVEANPENWVIHDGQLFVTQRSFGPPGFLKSPARWMAAAQEFERVLARAQIGSGISWW